MGADERHRNGEGELSKRTYLLEAAIGPAAPSLIHALATPIITKPRRRSTKARLWLTDEDYAFLKALAKSNRTHMGPLISRMATLFCRVCRTGRDPLTGEPIDWRAHAYGLDLTLSKGCADAIKTLREGHHGANDVVEAMKNAAQALDEVSACIEAARIGKRDWRMVKHRCDDTFEKATTTIANSADARSNSQSTAIADDKER